MNDNIPVCGGLDYDIGQVRYRLTWRRKPSAEQLRVAASDWGRNIQLTKTSIGWTLTWEMDFPADY